MPDEANLKEALMRFTRRLDNELSQKTDPLFFQFMSKMKMSGQMTDADANELGGYFKGLSVAKHMLMHTMCELSEEQGYTELCSNKCPYAEWCWPDEKGDAE